MKQKKQKTLRLQGKKLSAGLLAAVLLCGIPEGRAEAATPFRYNGEISPEIAAAYTRVLDEMYTRLNVTPLGYPADDRSPDNVFEACGLADFEGDHVPELFAAYHSESFSTEYFEVWRWNGAKAVCLTKQEVEPLDGLRYFDGNIYWSNVYGTNIYSIRNQKWERIKYLRGDYGDEGLVFDGTYWIDDQKVSRTDYYNERSKWEIDRHEEAEISLGMGRYSLQDAMDLYQQLSARYAVPSSAKLKIDGKYYELDAYNIENRNYFKLRDIARLMTGTPKEASVEGDAHGVRIAMPLNPDMDENTYQPTGTELKRGMAKADVVNRQLTENYSGRLLPYMANGSNRYIAYAYTIQGNKYFSIQDIGILFDFSVSWDGAAKEVIINTSMPY